MRVMRYNRAITQWCYRCGDWEEFKSTDCCDRVYPYCYLTVHQDGTTECYVCQEGDK